MESNPHSGSFQLWRLFPGAKTIQVTYWCSRFFFGKKAKGDFHGRSCLNKKQGACARGQGECRRINANRNRSEILINTHNKHAQVLWEVLDSVNKLFRV